MAIGRELAVAAARPVGLMRQDPLDTRVEGIEAIHDLIKCVYERRADGELVVLHCGFEITKTLVKPLNYRQRLDDRAECIDIDAGIGIGIIRRLRTIRCSRCCTTCTRSGPGDGTECL